MSLNLKEKPSCKSLDFINELQITAYVNRAVLLKGNLDFMQEKRWKLAAIGFAVLAFLRRFRGAGAPSWMRLAAQRAERGNKVLRTQSSHSESPAAVRGPRVWTGYGSWAPILKYNPKDFKKLFRNAKSKILFKITISKYTSKFSFEILLLCIRAGRYALVDMHVVLWCYNSMQFGYGHSCS